MLLKILNIKLIFLLKKDIWVYKYLTWFFLIYEFCRGYFFSSKTIDFFNKKSLKYNLFISNKK